MRKYREAIAVVASYDSRKKCANLIQKKIFYSKREKKSAGFVLLPKLTVIWATLTSDAFALIYNAVCTKITVVELCIKLST